nr:hypothetical protein [Pseudovibrio sp. M1P-2-3]
MRSTPDSELLEAFKVYLPDVEGGVQVLEWLSNAQNEAKFLAALPGLKERAKTLVELQESARYLWVERPLDFDEKAEKLLSEDARAVLARLLPHFEAVTDWSGENTEAAVRAFAEQED